MKVDIKLKEYNWTCADGCCSEFGTITVLNGEELPLYNTDVETILWQVLTHLGYDVTVETEYDE